MSKHKNKSSLGRDPFENMTDFDVEGPAPAVERVQPAPKVQPPTLRTFKKVTAVEEKPAAFAIADFFATLRGSTAEAQPTASVEEPETSTAVSAVDELPADTKAEAPTNEHDDADEIISEEIITAETDEAEVVDTELLADTVVLEPFEEEDPAALLADTAILDPTQVEELQIDELADTAVLEPSATFFEEAEADESSPIDTTDLADDDLDDDIFPTDAELRGILDTAQLALSAEHRLAVLLAEEEETAAEVAEPPLYPSQEPDLVFEWDEDDKDDRLPHWLVGTTSAEKIDTDSLKPLTREEDPLPSDPDLDLAWEVRHNDDDNDLPQWLVAETSASKIDTDKLNPAKVPAEPEELLAETTAADEAPLESAVFTTLEAWDEEEEPETAVVEAAIFEEESEEADNDESDSQFKEWAFSLDDAQAEAETEEGGWIFPEENTAPAPTWLLNAAAEYEDDDEDELGEEPAWLISVELDESLTSEPEEWFTAVLEETAAQENDADLATNWLADVDDNTTKPLAPQLFESDNQTASLLNDWLENNAYTADEDDPEWLTKNLQESVVDESEDNTAAENNLRWFERADEVFDDSGNDNYEHEETALWDDLPSELSELAEDETFAGDEVLPWDNTIDDEDEFEDDEDDESEDSLEEFDFSLDLSEFNALQTAALSTPSVGEEPAEAHEEATTAPLPEWVTEELLANQLPPWLEAEDSFILADTQQDDALSKDEKDEALVDAQSVITPDEFNFDFSFYEVDKTETPTPFNTTEENELTFEAAEFAFDELPNKQQRPEDLDLDSILQRFAELPTTQILSSPKPPQKQTESDNNVFDFNFADLPAEKKPGEKPNLDQLLDRMATLPPTRVLETHTKILESSFEASREESMVLENLLKSIDAEMGVTYASTAAAIATALAETKVLTQEPTPFYLTRGQFVVFKLDEDSFALPLDQVEGISAPPVTTPTPNVPAWVVGAAHIEGQNMLVIDLRRFFQIRSQPQHNLERLLAVHDAEQKVRVGLVVDEVKAIRVVESGEIQALTDKSNIHAAVQPYAYGRYEEIIMLDINRLFTSPDMVQLGLKA